MHLATYWQGVPLGRCVDEAGVLFKLCNTEAKGPKDVEKRKKRKATSSQLNKPKWFNLSTLKWIRHPTQE